MSRGLWFLIGDVLRRSVTRPAALIGWALAVAAVLLSGTALFLIPTGPGAAGAGAEAYLLAQLSTAPSEAAIAHLASEVWTWPGVDGVMFRFPGEDDEERDPVSLAKGRTKSFARPKRLDISTPTRQYDSLIVRRYLESDQHRYVVQLPPS